MKKLSLPLGVCALVSLLAASLPVQSANKASAKAAERPTVDVASLNPTARAAAQRGVKSCLNRINQVGNYLGQGVEMGVFLFNAPSEGEKHLFSTSMESIAGRNLSYASATFTPLKGEGCEALYETVSWWPGNCNDVAAKNFPTLTISGMLHRNMMILDGQGSLRIFLMPAGPGCVAIKKEVIF